MKVGNGVFDLGTQPLVTAPLAPVPEAEPPALAPASDGAIFSVSKNAHARFIPLGVSPSLGFRVYGLGFRV